MPFLQLLVEAILYYVACSLVARSRQDAPGLLRVFLVVLLLTFVSGGISAVIGDFWLSHALVFILSFFILWFGLGIGFFRTIIAAIIVHFLCWVLDEVFSRGGGFIA